jgi:hypothetical protein
MIPKPRRPQFTWEHAIWLMATIAIITVTLLLVDAA